MSRAGARAADDQPGLRLEPGLDHGRDPRTEAPLDEFDKREKLQASHQPCEKESDKQQAKCGAKGVGNDAKQPSIVRGARGAHHRAAAKPCRNDRCRAQP